MGVDGSIISVPLTLMVRLLERVQFFGCQKLVLMKSMELFVIFGRSRDGMPATSAIRSMLSMIAAMDLDVNNSFSVVELSGLPLPVHCSVVLLFNYEQWQIQGVS